MSIPSNPKCQIVAIGKRRDGGTRYWCRTHHDNATAKYGKRAKKCRYASIPPVLPSQTLRLDLDEYPGGIALWGAVPPVYDTTTLPIDKGIHVHARRAIDETKAIDYTYRRVDVLRSSQGEGPFSVSELDAIYFMVSSVFKFDIKYIACSRCSHAHLDRDWFSVHPHQSHLCAACGRTFRDHETAVGNPISRVANLDCASRRKPRRTRRVLRLRQAKYAGGIQIWGSNPAILWTAGNAPESGIHVHAYESDDYSLAPSVDETFSRVIIDGVELDELQVRTLMAQRALPHIADRVAHLSCRKCGFEPFDEDSDAFSPRVRSECPKCLGRFSTPGRLRKLIVNPLLKRLDLLATSAPRRPQVHDLGLIPEVL